MTTNQTGKLRDFIKSIRGCKTAAQEREVVQKEKALIRDSLNITNSDNDTQARNLAKLIFISMMGYDTDFGQMEALRLITQGSYAQKKIGYLGLTQLFNEKSDVLVLATHRMRIDLNNPSNFIISTSLAALSEICTSDMCRDLASDVIRLMTQGPTTYIKKKAILAATRIVRKVPEKIDEFADRVEILLEERHNSLVITSLALVQEIIRLEERFLSRFRKYVPDMIKVLKKLITSGQTEYEVSGINDPFLQVEILQFFRLLGAKDKLISEEISEILAQLVNNITTQKNAGNAVLYENVRTIMAIESASSLKTLGINILGRFLSNKDSNSKYVSLISLLKVLEYDISAVQKHKQMILECIKDSEDITIKKLALDVIYKIINEKNVKSISRELLNILILIDAGHPIVRDLTQKLCSSIERYSPTRRWYIDTLIKVLTLAGNHIKDESITQFAHIVSCSPQLHTYTIFKLFFSLRENINQKGLCHAGLLALGEFGNLLVSGQALGPDQQPILVKEDEVIDVIEEILLAQQTPDIIREIAVTCLMKLYTKFRSQGTKIMSLIDMETQSPSVELQQRACEYIKIIENDSWGNNRKALFELIPNYKQFDISHLLEFLISIYQLFYRKPIGDNEIDECPPVQIKGDQALTIVGQGTQEVTSGIEPQIARKQQEQPKTDLFESILEMGTDTQSTLQQQKQQSTNAGLDLLNLFGDQQQQEQSQQQKQSVPTQEHQQQNIFDLYDNKPQQEQPQPAVPQQGAQMNDLLSMEFTQSQPQPQPTTTDFTAFSDANIELIFKCQKVQSFCLSRWYLQESEEVTQVSTSFNNKSGYQIQEVIFQGAVLKHLKLTMNQLSSNLMPPYQTNAITSKLTVQNSMPQSKGIVMRLKISYFINGQKVEQQQQVNFPKI